MNFWAKPAFVLFLLSSSVPAMASTPGNAATSIRSSEQLAAWLQHPASPSALDSLSPGARERFLASVVFGRTGLGGFDPTDLALELDPEQVRAVLAMFVDDPDAYTGYVRPVDSRSRAAAAQRKAGISEIERGYNHFYLQTLRMRPETDVERSRAIADAHNEQMPAIDASGLRATSDGNLQLLLRAALDAASQSGDGALGDTTRRIFAEYERRGPAAPDEVSRMLNLLLATRHFNDAAQFAARHPQAGLPTLPTFVEAQTELPSVWQADGEGRWVRRGIDLAPVQIIVTAGCHFSADAADDISADPLLGPVFQQHALWLSSAPGIEDLDALAEWNRKRPKAQMTPIHARDEWALFPEWSMPVFHIVRNGKVVESVTGWPRNPTENREPLIAALKRAGLLRP